MRGNNDLLERGGLHSSGANQIAQDEAVSRAEFPEPASFGPYDVGLLFRRMAMFHIDRNALAKDDPLLFRELQGLCTLCQSKGLCAKEILGGTKSSAWHSY